jgi:hypothetical protein
MNFIKSFALIGFLLMSNYSFAWGTTGHRVVVEIAENHLSCKAKRQIKKIIGKQPLAYWANWGDFIKSNPDWKHADSWHYLNFPQGLSRPDFDKSLENSTDVNLYKRALIIMEDLKNHKNLSLEKKQENLYFLIHMLGDAHQPMHIGREEDLGGNKVEVEWFRSKTNIHSVWDSKIIDFQNYSYTEYAEVLDHHSKKYNKALVEGSFEDWLYDSYQKTENIYANVKNGDQLSFTYNYQNIATIEEQLLKAGLRLAKVLNEVFG